jgi:hypothetical protein
MSSRTGPAIGGCRSPISLTCNWSLRARAGGTILTAKMFEIATTAGLYAGTGIMTAFTAGRTSSAAHKRRVLTQVRTRAMRTRSSRVDAKPRCRQCDRLPLLAQSRSQVAARLPLTLFRHAPTSNPRTVALRPSYPPFTNPPLPPANLSPPAARTIHSPAFLPQGTQGSRPARHVRREAVPGESARAWTGVKLWPALRWV